MGAEWDPRLPSLPPQSSTGFVSCVYLGSTQGLPPFFLPFLLLWAWGVVSSKSLGQSRLILYWKLEPCLFPTSSCLLTCPHPRVWGARPSYFHAGRLWQEVKSVSLGVTGF